MSSDRLSWPVVTYESLPWVRTLEPGLASRTQLRRHAGPYRAAVLPEIAALTVALPHAVAADAEQASLEISRFDAELGGEIAPFGAVLLRTESAASSQIENLTASARAIAEAELHATGRRNADQIVANVRAMDAAVTLSEQLGGEAILAMHRALTEHIDPAIAGRVGDFRHRVVRGLFRQPFEADPDGPLVTTLRSQAARVLGHDPVIRAEPFWTDCALLAAAGIPCALFGVGGGGAHAATEWVDLASLAQVTAVLEATVREFCA